MAYCIYILYAESIDRYYVGYSTDPKKRLQQHLNNSADKYTGKAKDWMLKACFHIEKAEAVKIERFIKKQKSRKLIELLCDPHFVPTGYLANLVRVPDIRD